VSIRDGLDSSTSQGQIMMKLLSVIAELERSFIRDRTNAGLAAARAQGRVGGRPRVLNSKRAKQAQALGLAGQTPQDIAKLLVCSVSTVYRFTRTRTAEKKRAASG
jgi:DNA invertase Pin-like site-specific DNA recombinase